MRRVLLLSLVVAAGGWAFLFSLANADVVALDLVFLQLAPAALSVWVVAAFVAGGLCGLAAGSAAIWRARLALRAGRRAAPAGAGSGTPAAQAIAPASAGGNAAAR